MGVFDRWFDSDSEYRECRRCGTALEPGVESCPACGSSAVSVYRL